MSYLIDRERTQNIEGRYGLIGDLIVETDRFVSDPYVRYHLSRAYDSFMLKMYETTVVYSGLAIEEALVKVYSELTRSNPALKFFDRRTRKRLEANRMEFSSLTNWARRTNIGLITSSWGRDANVVDEIREARNFFVHSQRAISQRIRGQLARGYFVDIFPSPIARASLSSSQPPLGMLFTEDTANRILNCTVSILQRINTYLAAKGSSL
jgi:hypothetical protein